MLKSKSLITVGIGMLIFLSLNTYARFYFQDNTLLNSLRVCNDVSCENLMDSNISTVYGITSAYEIGGDKIQVNVWDFLKDNLYLVIGVLILSVGVIYLGRKVIFK